jgi:O-antigen ligase
MDSSEVRTRSRLANARQISLREIWSWPTIVLTLWTLGTLIIGSIKLTENGLYLSHILLAAMGGAILLFGMRSQSRVTMPLGIILFSATLLLPILAGVTDNQRFVSEQSKILLLIFGASTFSPFMTWDRLRALSFIVPFVLSFVAMITWSAGLSDYYGDGGRFGIPLYGSPNTTAFMLVMAIALALYACAISHEKGKIASIGLALILILFLALTGSDGGILTGVVVLARYLGFRMRSILFIFIALIAAIILTTAVYPTFEVPELVGSGRLFIWNYLITELFNSEFKHILFGMGPGAIDMDPWFTTQVVSAHSMYLEILYSYGLLGFFTLLAVLISVGVRLVNADLGPKERIFLEALYMALIAGAFVDTYVVTAQLVWFGALILGFFGLIGRNPIPQVKRPAGQLMRKSMIAGQGSTQGAFTADRRPSI